MLLREDFDRVLDELAAEIPRELYRELNGGIVVLEQAREHPAAKRGDLYIMGEYNVSREMGRYIAIYYGSYFRLYGGMDAEALRGDLRKTLRHEFLHHIESLAGEHGLEDEDRRGIEEYLRGSLNDPGRRYRIKTIKKIK